MEFSVREWTIIVGVLLIVAVFLDGYRRVRNERSNRIRVSLSKQVFNQQPSSATDAEGGPNPELPNGGARVIGKRREDLRLQQSVPVLIEPVAVEPIAPREPAPEPEPDAELEPEPEFETPFADIDDPEPITASRNDEVEPTVSLRVADEDREEHARDSWPRENPAGADDEYRDEARTDLFNLFEESAHTSAPPERDEPEAGGHGHEEFGQKLDSALKPLRNLFLRKESVAIEPPAAEAEIEPGDPQEVLVVNVLCKDGQVFKGPDLLQLLLACDLRFGKRSIFHRYEKANAKGAIQFSVANLVEPGTFNLDAIDSFTTPGVCFFMSLPGPEQPLTAFNYMVETAQVLVRHLHAELRDDAHSVMTAQTIEHCRQRIRDFERRQLTLQL